MLHIEHLNQYYGESHTLWDIDLIVAKGQCTCLMGRNGVGKTSLLGCIMGLLPIQSGNMVLAGNNISKRPAEQRAAMGIGYVPQGRQIFPLLTVQENLEIGLSTGRIKKKKIPELIFELFPVLHEMLSRRGGDLSGGQQQQLAIGRALVLDPTLLILDEPTEGIQPNIVQEIGEIINRLKNELSMTVLLVEQKLPFARSVADTFAILDRGRSVAIGTMDTLDAQLIAKYLTV
ncbi:MAG TPA: urea ABC transporter ATP-binding subunit UrtE [Desulfobacterales bacterium]|nr:urea ABC transporter ATP-binding subunit UrtE [Desulfobacterales bacterium]